MKKVKSTFLLMLVFFCIILVKISAKAYVVGENEPRILQIEFREDGEILKTGDTLHVRLKTENIDFNTYYRCRVLFTAHVDNGVDDITVECTYDQTTGYYQGESVPISKEEMGETKYSASFYGFYNEHPGVYGDVLFSPVLSFVYSDNCYNGFHKGGEPTCTYLPICSVCGKEYGNLIDHKIGDWEITDKPYCIKNGKKVRRCTECGLELAQETINPLGHIPEAPATCTKPQICTRCHEILNQATGHHPGSWETIKVSTCISPGEEIKKCIKCGTIVDVRNTITSNHIAGDWKITKAATGTKIGWKQKNCIYCGIFIDGLTIPKTFVKLNISSLPLQLKKSTTALKVTSITVGDSIKSWVSSNSKIVSVNKKTGKLTAKKTGKAKITVTTNTGAKATCTVTVQKETVKTKKLSVANKTVNLKKGKSYTISAIRNPITANDKTTYKTSNKKIATVSSKGKIVAKKKGKATITVKAGKAAVKITVVVK